MMKKDINYYLAPSEEELNKMFYDALRRNKVLILLTYCEVSYEGRSRSYLEPGERMIIIKKDKALLIHRPDGYKPINWQPSQTEILLEKRNEDIYLFSIRKKPYEKLLIKLIEIYFALSIKLVDTGEFYMYLTEKEMQDLLYRYLSIIEEGLRPISREKEIKSGKIDILARDKDDNHVIIELKKHKIGERDVLQLYRYVKELRESNPSVRGVIVGPTIDQKAVEMINSLKLEYKIISIKKLKRLMKK